VDFGDMDIPDEAFCKYTVPCIAFDEGSNINKLKFGSGTIGDYAFMYCTSITSIDLGQVTSIGDYAFYECTGISGTLSIPSSVTSIGEGAFNGCIGISGTLTIQSSVTSIGNFAFNNCSSIFALVFDGFGSDPTN
jgi:hypothetical protein